MLHPSKSTIRKRHYLRAHGIMHNFPRVSFQGLYAQMLELETDIRNHMPVAIAEAYTSTIVLFLHDELYLETEASMETDREEHVSRKKSSRPRPLQKAPHYIRLRPYVMTTHMRNNAAISYTS